MGKAAKKSTRVNAVVAPARAPQKGGKRDDEVAALEEEEKVSAKKQKSHQEAALKKTRKKKVNAAPERKVGFVAKPPVESSSDDDSSSEEELPAKKQPVASAKNGTKVSAPVKKAKQASSSSSESDLDNSDSEEDEKPKGKKASNWYSKCAFSSDGDVYSSSSEEVSPTPPPPPPAAARMYRQAEGATKTVFVGNLSFNVERADVEEFFKEAGEVVDVRFSTDREGSFRGYGHVEFATPQAAQKALELNDHYLLNRPVRLDLARERGAYTPHSRYEKTNSFHKGRQAQGQSIYIRGFDKSAGEDEIRSALLQHFGLCGEITRCSIPIDYDSGEVKGFAYMDFNDSGACTKALELNGTELGGWSLMVFKAIPRDEVNAASEKKVGFVAKPPVESSGSDDSDSTSEEELPAKQPLASAKNGTKSAAPLKKAKQASSSSSESESDDSDSEEAEKPKGKKASNWYSKCVFSSDDDVYPSSSEEVSATPPPARMYPQGEGASKSVFVRNLSFNVERADVEEFFKEAGEVVDVRFATDREGSFRGYGHVEFATPQAAQKALKLNDHELLNRPVRLDLARERGAYTLHGGNEKTNSFQKGEPAQGQSIYIRGFDTSGREYEGFLKQTPSGGLCKTQLCSSCKLQMGKKAKKSTKEVNAAPALVTPPRAPKKGKRNAEVAALEEKVSAKKQKSDQTALKTPKKPAKKEFSSSSEGYSSDSDEELQVKITPNKKVALYSSEESSSDDESSSEEDSSDDDSSSEEDSSDDESPPEDSSSDDDSSSEEDVPSEKQPVIAAKNGSLFHDVSSESEESDSAEDEKAEEKTNKVEPGDDDTESEEESSSSDDDVC